MSRPTDRPQDPKDRPQPLNPCVVCWRTKHLLAPATYVAQNAVRTIILCTRHYREFRDMDQDVQELRTTYRLISPGERVTVGGQDLW